MRCSCQYGYMLLVKDSQYDMLKDPLFDKFRIELDEELCQWIFAEMDQGNKVYPNDDIPAIDKYMWKIRNSRVISKQTFDHVSEKSEQQAAALKKALHKIGYCVASGQVEHITNNKLRKINRQYSLDVALSKMDTEAKSRPIIMLPSNMFASP